MKFTTESTAVADRIYDPIHSPTIIPSEEEEDMANCLIMLAHSDSVPCNEDRLKPVIGCQKTEKLKIRSVTEMSATTAAGGGNFGYECKTCNRAFPSFQALGGHRASHKKPKLTVDDKSSVSDDQTKVLYVYEQNRITAIKPANASPPSQPCQPSPPAATYLNQTLYKNSTKAKVHECSICGAEFLSGQALGGHMRRHRTAPPSNSATEVKLSPEKSHVLCLDLNLPPPEVVDDGHGNFQFTASSSPQGLVFSRTALVDCHY